MPNRSSLSEEAAIAREIAVAAGKVLTSYFSSNLSVEMKGWADPVTVADRESEALIRSALKQYFPTDGIVGEEEPPQPGTSGRIWVVDPLDGTVNFAGGMPLFAVVLALVESRNPNQAIVNVTYDPMRNEIFHAVRGGGAFLQDQRIHVTDNTDLARAMVHLHFSN